ncbi:MAG TPA: condensation domain-containing protein, partial [Verrucomicrobiae bacterium]|nr:condensation domain-containing protein [Verrucomicrobiae bacterium]
MSIEHRTLDTQEDFLEATTDTLMPERIESSDTDRIGRCRRSGHLPLSFAQQRLWFLDQLHPESSLYNVPVALRLEGALNECALRRSLATIVERHGVLRTRFVAMDGNPTQFISPNAAVELPVKDLSGLPEASRQAEAHRLLAAEAKQPFNLAQDLMMRCLLLRMAAHENILMVT